MRKTEAFGNIMRIAFKYVDTRLSSLVFFYELRFEKSVLPNIFSHIN